MLSSQRRLVPLICVTMLTASSVRVVAQTATLHGVVVDSLKGGVLKGSTPTTVVATLGLCVSLVPLGVRVLRRAA